MKTRTTCFSNIFYPKAVQTEPNQSNRKGKGGEESRKEKNGKNGGVVMEEKG